MKNIRTYEAFFKKPMYNGGDYVIVKINGNEKEYHAKVESYNQVTYFYLVKVFEINDIRWLYQHQIVRMMTPEEIEKLKIELDANKYNL